MTHVQTRSGGDTAPPAGTRRAEASRGAVATGRGWWTRSRVCALAVALGACGGDALGPAAAARERAGTIRLNEPRTAVVLTFTPATSVDSVVAGGAPGSENAVLTSLPEAGQVLLYRDPGLPTTMRFRAFLHDGQRASEVQVSLTTAADSSGRVDPAVTAGIGGATWDGR